MIIFAAGGHKNSSGWAAADFAYHGLAAFFYLSAGVALANITINEKTTDTFKNYQIDIAAVVFAYLATLFYFIHTILSSIRWKNFWRVICIQEVGYCASCVPLCVCVYNS